MNPFKRISPAWFPLMCILAGIAIACGGSAADAPALWKEQPNQKILFMSRADAPEGELYLLDKDGQITRLTDNVRHENNPALSFDGRWAAFHGGEEGDMLTWEIYILALETGEETRLTHNGVIDGHPDWSPDGSRIVFGSFRDAQGNPAGAADIYVIRTDGSELTQLTDSPWEDNDPEWSPDGSRIVFKSTRNTQIGAREEIYIMDSDGANPRRLTTTSGWQSDHDPSWSPQGDQIVFTRFEGERAWYDFNDFAVDWETLTPWNVHRVDLDGNLVRLTDSPEAGWGVALYSADASQIVYGTIDWITNAQGEVIGGQHRVMLVGTDGSNPRQLLEDDRHTGTLEYFDW